MCHVEDTCLLSKQLFLRGSQFVSTEVVEEQVGDSDINSSDSSIFRQPRLETLRWAGQPDGKLCPQVQGRDSHLCRAAHSVIVVLSRNSKVLNARVIRWPQRFVCEGSYSDSKKGDSKNGSLRDNRYYRPNRAVPPVKSHTQRDHAKSPVNGRNRR